ncbi:MAG TPA: GNAT family N-acetyltransferase [Pyrinomonadaceae bacterium]|jgi:predicted GNAT superfamily acetyltransferase|nr:GNAT family N-acetyltransferase [Pyrinomonadaceae bacterium]
MPNSELPIEIRECTAPNEFDACISLQKEVFALPDLEISPRRHLIVTKHAGGWTLGAFVKEKLEERLIGFVLSLPAFRGEERILYSHMTAVKKEFQSHGIGAKLKWAQRERALSENIRFIKWTFEPVQPRNAYFNLMRLGAVVKTYMPNFYGTDYGTTPNVNTTGFDSDRLFAEWQLDSEKVINAVKGNSTQLGTPVRKITVPPDWRALVINEPEKAKKEQLRIREEFIEAFTAGLICEAFERDVNRPAYLFFKQKNGNLPTASP